MKKIKVSRFLRDTRGTTAIEYAIIASGIAGAIIATVAVLGANVTAMWASISGLF